MAGLIGKDGAIHAGGNKIVNMDSWSLNPSVATAEVTAYGDSWEKHDATIKAWSATCAGTAERTTGQTALFDQLEDAALANVTLYFLTTSSTSASYWSGAAITENWSLDSAVKDRVGVSFSFKGDGALAWTT